MSLFNDTSSEAEAYLYQRLRTTPAWRKLEMVGELNATVRSLALSGLRKRHPYADLAALHRLLADQLLGIDLAAAVLGQRPTDFSPEQAHAE